MEGVAVLVEACGRLQTVRVWVPIEIWSRYCKKWSRPGASAAPSKKFDWNLGAIIEHHRDRYRKLKWGFKVGGQLVREGKRCESFQIIRPWQRPMSSRSLFLKVSPASPKVTRQMLGGYRNSRLYSYHLTPLKNRSKLTVVFLLLAGLQLLISFHATPVLSPGLKIETYTRPSLLLEPVDSCSTPPQKCRGIPTHNIIVLLRFCLEAAHWWTLIAGL